MTQDYGGDERRQFPRANANFIISYRMTDPPCDYDLSQSKNVSQGGILLTTNQAFEKGTFLAMTIRFPFVTRRIDVTGKVVGCKEIVKSIIYETHVQFVDLDMSLFQEIGQFVNQLLDNK